MANLGTLWFGADIDLSNLKRKLQEGNREALNALKVDYDQSSYTQMVSKLKTALANERFEVKISTNMQSVSQSVRDSITQVGRGGIGNPTSLKGVDELTKGILDQRQAILDFRVVGDYYQKQQKELGRIYGANSKQARDAAREYDMSKENAREYGRVLTQMNIDKQRAALYQREHNKAMKQGSAAAAQLNTDSLRLNTTLANGIHISTRLGSALSSLFAIDAARQFLGNVIEIGGQLEKQRISIGAILGDTAKANHLFEQIKGLALKSPFGVVELDQYTKQLSAYGFKYNELFDMTKRLADISAGAGQDIGRLTLALGHVRSATYLTGITLRQFSMNNIPMLKMLADYYTEVEGKIVSTAEVQKRISKRQVSYEDVIEQIRRLTNEGGMFYNMQEKISDSLSAKFKNLKDAMDIMYGEIAESSVGDFMKDFANSMTKATRHWREFAGVLAVASAAFLISKTRIGMNTLAMQSNTAATLKKIMADKQAAAAMLRQAAITRTLTTQEQVQLATANQLRVADIKRALASGVLTKEEALRLVTLKQIKIAQAMHLVGVQGITAAEIKAATATNRWAVALRGVGVSLKNAFTGIGAGTWATIGAMVGMELYMAYTNWVSRIDEKTNELKDIIKSRIIDLEKEQKIIDAGGKPKDTAELKARVDEMKQVLANSEAYTKTLDEQVKGAADLNEQYDILNEAIGNSVEGSYKMLAYQDEINQMIKASKGDFGGWDWAKLGLLGFDSLFGGNTWDRFIEFVNSTDISSMTEKLNEAYQNLRKTTDSTWEYRDAIKSVVSEIINSSEAGERFNKQLENAPYEEQIRLLIENGYWEKIQNAIEQTGKKFNNSQEEIDRACKNIRESADGVSKHYSTIAYRQIPKIYEKLKKERDWNEEQVRKWAENNVDDVKMMLNGMLDQIGEKSPTIRKEIKRMLYEYMRLGYVAERALNSETVGNSMQAGLHVAMTNINEAMDKVLSDEELATLKDDNPKDNGSKSGSKTKTDKALDNAKERFSEVKAFLAEYKKYIKHYDKESAINILEGLFPSLKGEGKNIVDDYTGVLEKLRDSLKMTTNARKKFATEINKATADYTFDTDEEKLKKSADAMKEYVSKVKDQWKNYRDLLKKSGGNKELASLAFTDGAMWDEASKSLLQKFNELGNQYGVIPVNLHWDMNEQQMNEALRDAKGVVHDDMIDTAKEIQKIIRGNYEQFLKDTAEAYNKSLTAAEKLVELEQQRVKLIEEANAYNGDNKTIKEGYDTQIAAKDREIAKQRLEAFKETEEWGRIFGNLDKISNETLRNMLDKMKALAPTVNESVEATKALYEAIAKIEETILNRNPFAAMAESLRMASVYSNAIAYAKNKFPDSKGDEIIGFDAKTAGKLGLTDGKLGWTGTLNELRDKLRGTTSDFSNAVRGIADKFKAMQDVLQPVIDLFDTLGNTTLSDLFKIGSNALGSAASAASGMSSIAGMFKSDSGIGKLLGAAGPYAAAAAAGLSIVTSLFQMHDQSLQKKIEASQARQKEMQNLSKNLETALSRTLGGVYRTKASGAMLASLRKEIAATSIFDKAFGGGYKTYISKETKDAVKEAEKTKTYYDAAYASMLAQRDELQHQMALEEDKKKSDSDKLADYKQQLIEMEDQIENFAADMAKSLYDIDLKSWAKELTDTIVEAWKKGENAVDAYKSKVKEMMLDLTTNILSQKVMEKALSDVGIDKLISNLMTRTKGQLDEKSVAQIAEALNKAGEMSATTITAVLDEMERKGFVSKGEGASKEGSISNTIKGITEDTAGLLASYINAIRADVSVNRQLLTTSLPTITLDVSRISVLAETQVAMQQQIAENTRRNADAADRIYDLLHRVAPDGQRILVK